MTKRTSFKSDPDTEESEKRSRTTQLEHNVEELNNRIAELTLENQELRRRFSLDLRREVREENQARSQILRNSIGQVETDNRILRNRVDRMTITETNSQAQDIARGVDIADLAHPFKVVANPNTHSPGKRIEVTNSRNRSGRFGIVIAEREGRVYLPSRTREEEHTVP